MFQHAATEPDATDDISETTVARALGPRLMAFARARLRSAQTHLARQDEACHAGIHEARKCLRRVRATLALGADALSPGTARLDRELARRCRGLSPLRDAQALIEGLRRLDGGVHGSTALFSRAHAVARCAQCDQGEAT